MISGWLFDAYALNGSMIFWIKKDNSSTTIRLEDKSWNHKIYVASEKSLLKSVIENNEILSMVKEYHFISKYGLITDTKKSQVLELKLKDPTYALKLAKKIEKMGRFGQSRLYNVDILPEQSYFYEHDVFPLMKCKVHVSNSTLNWIDNEDDVWSTEYELPLFNNIHLIVPLSLEILLKKRAHYKDKRNSTTDPELKRIYDARQTALKWVLVTSFGYLGFNNAKFGRIDMRF